jgi:hypothetical protein
MAMVGCAPSQESAPVSERLPQQALLEFTATVDVAAGTVTFLPDSAGPSGALTEQPIVQDGTPGVGPADTVELVTTAAVQTADGCGTGVWSLDATVDLRSFFASVRLRNAHVEILSMTPTGREACNSALEIPVGHSAQYGLFAYGNLDTLGMATATWRFRLPSSANFTFRGRVVADPVTVVETTPPTVSITSVGYPLTGTVVVQIAGADNSGSVSGQLYVDGVPYGTAIPLPGQVNFDSTAFGNGLHVLTVVATDPSGNETTSAPYDGWVDNGVTGDRTPPTAEVYTDFLVVSGTTDVAVLTYDEYYPLSVQLYVDGAPYGLPVDGPLVPGNTETWLTWDTTGVADGLHTLTARVTDPAGNEGISASYEVEVINASPVVTITSPSEGAGVGTTFTATASVAAPVYGWVDFYVDGIYAGTAWTPDYSVDLTVGAGAHTLEATTWDAADAEVWSVLVNFTAL